MSAHTPGPWTTLDYVAKVSNFGGWQGRIEAGGTGIGKAFGGDKNTVLANVTLMAAAPDLLEALQGTLNQLAALERALETNSDGRLNFVGLPPPSETECNKRALAAIAKATGEMDAPKKAIEPNDFSTK